MPKRVKCPNCGVLMYKGMDCPDCDHTDYDSLCECEHCKGRRVAAGKEDADDA